jgi:hypothetical protein
MKNRMRESRSFGSVRGEGREVLAYSENQPCSSLICRDKGNGRHAGNQVLLCRIGRTGRLRQLMGPKADGGRARTPTNHSPLERQADDEATGNH